MLKLLFIALSLLISAHAFAQDAKGGCSSTPAQGGQGKCYDSPEKKEVYAEALKRIRIDQVFRKGGSARQWFYICINPQTTDFDEYRLESLDTLWGMISEAEAGRLDWVIPATFAKKYLVDDRGGRYGALCHW